MTCQPLITVTNISTKETVRYSLPLIKGYITPCAESDNNNSVHESHVILKRLRDNLITRWPIVNGNFKCLAELEPGENSFHIEYLHSHVQIDLHLRSTGSPYHVLPVYITTSDNDGEFQGPEGEDCSADSARRRIALGSKLIQTVTAEKLLESDLGRRTFQLAQDLEPSLDCIIFRSALSSQEIYDKESEEIWEYLGRELMSSQYGRDDRKFLAFLACTRYSADADVDQVRGHVALGGGGLALFGTGCLHTWPEKVQDVVSRFNDATKIDTTRFMDDSCYRGTLGSCFSTTLGAVCHELGHAFDLGHSRKGIMARGFDNISLVFTVGNSNASLSSVINRTEAQHATVTFTRHLNLTYSVCDSNANQNTTRSRPVIHSSATHDQFFQQTSDFKSNRARNTRLKRTPSPPVIHSLRTSLIPIDDLTFWDRSCAVLLRYHRWFSDRQNDSISADSNSEATIEFDPIRKMISSPWGIRVIEIRGEDGLVLNSWEFLSAWVPKQFVLPMNAKEMHEGKTVVAEDNRGNLIKEIILTG